MGAELQARYQEMQQAKADASAAVKQATANFKRERQEEREAKEKGQQVDNLYSAHNKVMKVALACLNESRMMYGYLKVCEMRLEAREKRPKRDLFRDYVQEALENEWRSISESREELQAIQHAGEKIHDQCKRVKVLLVTGKSRENTYRRTRKALAEASNRPMQTSSSLPSLPAISPSSRLETVGEHEVCSGVVEEGPSIRDLLKVSYALVAKALEIVKHGEEALLRTRARCDSATAAVTKSLDIRKAELKDVKTDLERQQVETDHTISDVELRISGLKSFREPETPRSKNAAEEQLREAEEVLAELKKLKLEIDEDLSCKKAALKIDTFCRNVTTIRAGGHIPTE